MQSKTNSVEGVVNPSPSRWSSLCRWLRYATLVMLGVMFCVTLVFWIRSYWRIDHLHGILPGEHRLFARSGGGEIVFTEYTLLAPTPYPTPYQTWETRSYAVNEFPLKQEEFGISVAEGIASQFSSERPVRVLWTDASSSPSPQSPLPVLLPGPLDMTSHGIAIPHLLLLLLTSSLFFLILRRWQFSLRAFFIWVTIICIAMACAVALTSAVKEISVYHNHNLYIF